MSANGPTAGSTKPLLQSGAIYWWREALVGQIEFFQCQFAKHIGIADAALCKFELGDNLVAGSSPTFNRSASQAHILDGFRVKSLTGKKGSDRHDVLHA
jgi:hypothetical protein